MTTQKETNEPQLAARAPVRPCVRAAFYKIAVWLTISILTAGLTAGCHREPADRLQVSGRIEGYETDVGAKIGGRVDDVTVREGNLVKQGQLLAQISDADIQAQLRGASARIDKAKEQVEQIKNKIEEIQTRVAGARLLYSQMQEDSLGKIRQWESTVASDQARVSEAKAALTQSKADLDLARVRKERYEILVTHRAVTRDAYDAAVTNYETAKAVVTSREASVEAVRRVLHADQGQLTQAKSTRLNPAVRQQELRAYQMQLLQRICQ